jgi:beta-xylosidase
MKIKLQSISFAFGILLPACSSFAQDTAGNKKYIAYDGSQVKYTAEELALKLPGDLKPVIDYPMRDISVCLGPDSTYYMTGTTGDPDWWAVTGDIQVRKSKDMRNWLPVITQPRKRSVVWNADREGSEWNKKIQLRDGVPFRPLWAPEIYYMKGTFWLTYCFPRSGNGILKSTSGKAEGPYVSALANEGPLSVDIDASLFQDDNGKVYVVAGEGNITPMKDDVSGPAGASVLAKPGNAKHVGFEGAFLFKVNTTYYMAAAEFVNGEYQCFVASSDNIYGPYGDRYLAIPHAGHNTFFKDVDGNWWSTFFGNDKNAPFKERPALLRVIFDERGHIKPMMNHGNLLSSLTSPVILKGDERTAYRDPAVLYHDEKFYLFYTLSQTEADGRIFSYTAMRISKDLKSWSDENILTPKDQSLDFSSPGNVVLYNNEWMLCLQTYPRPGYTANKMPMYGTKDARLYAIHSKDLEHWSAPELLMVKGPDSSFEQMGRMIDPYLLEDKDVKGKWWCFYKQNGVSLSYSYDLKNWTYTGHTQAGENTCVLMEDNEYVLFHSPENGIGIKRSADLKNWNDWGDLITLGQKEWPWARGRITAGAVLNLKKEKNIGKYVMFFHGSGPLTEKQGDFDKNASIGIAWSDDLLHWNWPGQNQN